MSFVSDSNDNNKKKGLLFQAGIFAIAGMISRVIGLLYRSPLTAVIGDEGNGYYGAAYSVYSIVLLISSYSIPSAMAKIISQRIALKEYKNAQRIFRCALIYVAIVGGIGCGLLLIGANFLAAGRSATVLRFFAPTVFVFGFLGVLRGYFQAHRTMVPTSISQLVEQVMNAIVSISAALILTGVAGPLDSSKRAMYGAVGSAMGTGAGVLVALIFMLFVYYMNKGVIRSRIESDHGEQMSDKEIFKLIFLIVTPFILSTCIYNLSNFLNWTLFSRILMYIKGMEESSVASMYGIFNTKAVAISNLPIALASAAAAAMIPEISVLFARGDKKGAGDTISRVNKVILVIAIPCAAGLLFLAKPVMMILFPQKASLDEAAMLLRFLSVTVVFYSLSTLSNAVLQGIGKVNTPVVNALIALVVQSGVLSLLLMFTNLGDVALCLVTVLYSLLMCILNTMSLKKHINAVTDYQKAYILPTISALIMGACAYGVYALVNLAAYGIGNLTGSVDTELSFFSYLYSNYFVNLVASAIAILVAVLIYFAVLIRSGGATTEDIMRLPKGSYFVKIFRKIRILR